MTDDQPTQPLTDAELETIREDYQGVDEYDSVLRLLAEVDRLRAENAAVKTKCDGFQKMMNSAVSAGVTIDGERLDAIREVEQLQSALTALGRNERAAANRALELQEENERLRLEAVQMESGAQIAMNAGVVALQEVQRLEIERDDLKLINDRMAEDRLRLVDERDSILADLLQYSQLHWEDCPLGKEDCYLCEGYERIRANAAERRHSKAPNQ